MKECFYMKTPIGTLGVECEDDCVAAIYVAQDDVCDKFPSSPFAMHVKKGVDDYFSGAVKGLEFNLILHGTAFQVMVWRELLRIPYGEVATYGEIAERIGRPCAVRAVGVACNRNPLLLAVPCHRVVGAGGTLTGFAVGLERKRFLLEMEGAAVVG